MWDFLKSGLGKSLASATGLAGGQFFLNLVLALRDGVIEPDEWHGLLTSASGMEFVFLGGIMIFLGLKK